MRDEEYDGEREGVKTNVEAIFVNAILESEEAVCVSAILEKEHEGLKSNYKLISWHGVHFLRCLVIVVLKTFLINPILRSLIFLAMFLLFLLHDIVTMPFKKDSLNLLQILMTSSFFLLSGFNFFNAFSYMGDVTNIPYFVITIEILGYLEIMLLLGLVPLWLVTWKIWIWLEQKDTYLS